MQREKKESEQEAEDTPEVVIPPKPAEIPSFMLNTETRVNKIEDFSNKSMKSRLLKNNSEKEYQPYIIKL